MNFKGTLNDLVFPIIKLFKKENYFIFRNKVYKYCLHKDSWNSERIVEIPIVMKYIDSNKRILELGDVLYQFTEATWDIVDKYPTRSGIIGVDIIDYKPKEKYDIIISVSTLEHIGFNEDVSGGEKPEDFVDNNKTEDAINNLKNNCLNQDGTIIITVPLGYNIEMDKKLFETNLEFTKLHFMKRISKNNEWKEINKNEIINPEYGYPFPCANYICIGIFNG